MLYVRLQFICAMRKYILEHSPSAQNSRIAFSHFMCVTLLGCCLPANITCNEHALWGGT